ncbi:transposase [Chryseobacterium turcicum]|uniref:Transposase n=1 Tax=Chryseobacterium turcicum TaxID=2898076 RepID=A0A9Q3YVM2_9FLAO|nr:transposase [Chryseobacterium turcicum]MCD1117581.1 transposase [Chryseobacterium turcicum]
MDFKNIHIGSLIEKTVTERGIEISRICNFIDCTIQEALAMYEMESMESAVLLRWSKLLEYDFFRIYSQHLILFAPQAGTKKNISFDAHKFSLPQFRKNIYTRDLIDFILERINSGAMTKEQVIEKYRIPKTTLYKWIDKYKLP